MSKITQNTLVPIGLAVAVIGGGAAWMTRQEMTASANAKGIKHLQGQYEHIDDMLREIQEKLGTIEGELKRISKRRD